MRLIRLLSLRIRSLFLRNTVEQELNEELRYHIQRQIEMNVASGMDQKQARRAALRAFGAYQQRKEECQDMRGLNLVDDVKQDLGFAIRQLWRTPGFAVTAIVVLALGLCCSIAIFAFFDAALLKPLPYRDTNRLVAVYESIPQCPKCYLSYLDFVDWKKLNTVFSEFEAYRNTGAILTTPGGAQPAPIAHVTAGFFRMLGVTPMLGRDFQNGEDRPGASNTAILSNSTWKARFGGDPAVVGQTVILDGDSYLVIGVLPADFHFVPAEPAEFWTPLDGAGPCDERRSCHGIYGVARLRQGVSMQAAMANTKSIAAQLEKQFPVSNRDEGANVTTLTEAINGDIRPIFFVLLGGASLLLLIACVNVASLLLVRSESRSREIAIRAALGASGGRLTRQFATEGLLLVGISTVAGLALASWTMRLLAHLIPRDLMAKLPFLNGLGLNPRVLAFASVISLAAAILFTVTPALYASVKGLGHGLVEGSRGSAGNAWRRLGSKLVSVELALAVVLLVVAGLLGQSLYRLLRVDLGFQQDHLATLGVTAPEKTYQKNEQSLQLGKQVEDRMSVLPGVQSVATTTSLPVSRNTDTLLIRFVGHAYSGEHNEVNWRTISADYFKTIRARIIRGRDFSESDGPASPRVAIINEACARLYCPGEDPIGKQIGNAQLAPESLRQVIGVVENVREGQLDDDIWPAEYFPFKQDPQLDFSLVVRTSQPAQLLIPTMAASIKEIDPGIVTYMPAGMEERINNSPSVYLHRSAGWLVGVFAAMASLLSVVGLYGVIAYSVGGRTREIGVRMALGAKPGAVYAMILKEASVLAAIGLGAGVVCSLALGGLIKGLLFGTQAWSVPTILAVVAVLGAAALLASFVPARRAASVNPVEALRSE